MERDQREPIVAIEVSSEGDIIVRDRLLVSLLRDRVGHNDFIIVEHELLHIGSSGEQSLITKRRSR